MFRLREGRPLQYLTVEATSPDAELGAQPCPEFDPGRPHLGPGWSLDAIGELQDSPRDVVAVEDTIHNQVGCYLVERLHGSAPDPWFRYADDQAECGDGSDGSGALAREQVFPSGVETRLYRFIYPPILGIPWRGRT